MSTTDARARDRKLVIASESLGGAEAALMLCRTILEWSPARPTAIIVEPEATTIWAGREPRLVSTRGGVLAAPPLDRLRRIARGDASLLGPRISGLAEALNTDWDCHLSAGELVSTACAALDRDDILLLGQRPVFRGRGGVLLLGSDRGVSEASRLLAEALARALATAVSVLLPGGHGAQGDIATLVERRHAGAVVIDLDAVPIEGEDSLRRLFSAARCPVVALGASRMRRGKAQGR